jgi:formylglycine-generating enzyme required for sulfatase activity
VRAFLCLFVLLSACQPDAPPAQQGTTRPSATVIEAASDEPAASASGVPQERGVAQRANERIDIPAGEFRAGSTPGDAGRNPTLESRRHEVKLDAFSIDRLPYPNDPKKPPVTGVSRKKAASLCAEGGGRLCTELEWERACSGPKMTAYAGAARFDQACAAAPQTCASGFGVLAMGSAMREWTASDVMPIKRLQRRAAAIRGASAKSAAVDHRCARRSALARDVTGDDLGFRCCYGPANAASIASPKWLATFRPADVPPSRLSKMFAALERLAPLSKDVKYFREAQAVRTVRRRAKLRRPPDSDASEDDKDKDPPHLKMTTAPTLWNPVPGEEVLLVTGRSGKDSFIVGFYHLGDDRYRVAATLWMKDELGPVVFVQNKYVRRKLNWTTCWKCYGETGNITYREDGRVVITQQ